jgi:hypothetical protein
MEIFIPVEMVKMTDKANIQLMLALYLKKAFDPKSSIDWCYLPMENVDKKQLLKYRRVKLARCGQSVYLTRLGKILVAGEILLRKKGIWLDD